MKPKLNMKILKVPLPESLKVSAQTVAAEQETSLAELIRTLLRREIERHKRSQRQETRQ